MNALDEIAKLKERKLALRERARELASRIVPIEAKKRRPNVGIGILDQFYASTLALDITLAEAKVDSVARSSSQMNDEQRRSHALKLLRDEERSISVDDGRIRESCIHAPTDDTAYFFPVLSHEIHGEYLVSDLYEKWQRLVRGFEHDIANIDHEIAPLKSQCEDIDREIFEINAKLTEIAQAAQVAISG